MPEGTTKENEMKRGMKITVDGNDVTVLEGGLYKGTFRAVDESDAELARDMIDRGEEPTDSLSGEWIY